MHPGIDMTLKEARYRINLAEKADDTFTLTWEDGFEAAETLRNDDPEGFKALCHNDQSFRRHFPGNVNLAAEFPTISINSFGNITGVRINDRVSAPLSIPSDQVGVYYRAMKRLLELCEDDNRAVKSVLKPGDIAIFDNHRVLHRRTRLTITGSRWLQWVQVERGDLFSTLKIQAECLEREPVSSYGRGAYG